MGRCSPRDLQADVEDGPTGPSGPPPSNVGVVSEADAVFATITSVTANSPVVVNFKLTDRDGKPLKGLAAGSTRFALAKLATQVEEPGSGISQSSKWVSYINVSRAPDAAYLNGSTQIQATTETGAAARFVHNGDGSYRYTFSFDIANVTSPAAVPYEPNLTHRVAIQLSGVPAFNNASYDFVPAGGAVTTKREIVNNAACNACHDVLFFHSGATPEQGGGRRDTQYCVTCHNPRSQDPEANNSVGMKVLIQRREFMQQEQPGVRQSIRAAWGNRPFVFGVAIYLFTWVAVSLLETTLLFFIKYVVQRESQSDLSMATIFVTAILVLPLWEWVSRRLNKRRAYIAGIAFWALVQIVMVTLNQTSSLALLLFLCALAGIGVSAAHVLPWSIIPDAIEWGEWHTGERHEGMFYSLVTLSQKGAASIAIPLVLLMLEAP